MAIRSFMWGIETWEAGTNEFLIRFVCGPARILQVKGTATAAPQPSHVPFSQMIRQSLATLINVDADPTQPDIKIIKTPSSRANQSVSNHLFSLNIKQLNAQAIIVPVHFDYTSAPVILAQNALMMHIHNESYKMQDSAAIVSKDQVDALNLEMHLQVLYETDFE